MSSADSRRHLYRTVSYSHLWSLPNFSNEKIELSTEVGPGEDLNEAFLRVKREVERLHRVSADNNVDIETEAVMRKVAIYQEAVRLLDQLRKDLEELEPLGMPGRLRALLEVMRKLLEGEKGDDVDEELLRMEVDRLAGRVRPRLEENP